MSSSGGRSSVKMIKIIFAKSYYVQGSDERSLFVTLTATYNQSSTRHSVVEISICGNSKQSKQYFDRPPNMLGLCGTEFAYCYFIFYSFEVIVFMVDIYCLWLL